MIEIAGRRIYKMWHVENGRDNDYENGAFTGRKDEWDDMTYLLGLEDIKFDMKNRIGKTVMPVTVLEKLFCVPIAYREYWENKAGDIWGNDNKDYGNGKRKGEFICYLVMPKGKKVENIGFVYLRVQGYSTDFFKNNVIKVCLDKAKKHNMKPRDFMIEIGISDKSWNNGDNEKEGIHPIILSKLGTYKSKEIKDEVIEYYNDIVSSGWMTEYKQRDFTK